MSRPMPKQEFCEKFAGGFCPHVQKIVPKSWCLRVCKGEWQRGDSIQPGGIQQVIPINAKVAKPDQAAIINKLNIVERAKFAFNAFIRAGKDSFKLVDEKIFIERSICCTTCGGARNCPHCTCRVGIKAKLRSELGCPNPQTYPGLQYYPPRNYWEVCEQKTTAIIIGRNEPAEWFNKTIADLFATATGKLEVIAMVDGFADTVKPASNWGELKVITNPVPQGRRRGINAAVAQATGDYLFVIDAHCRMSEGWDTRLKCACDKNTIAVATIKSMLPDFKNELVGHHYGFAYISPACVEKWHPAKPAAGWPIIEQMMGFTGCAWMIHKDDYHALGGYDESLGEYGYDGPEWALKIQLQARGQVVLRKDVTCWHIFGTNTAGKLYRTSMLPASAIKNYMTRKYGWPAIDKLAEKFAPLPEWDKPENVKTIVCCLSNASDTKVVEYCTGKLKEFQNKVIVFESRRQNEPLSHRTYYKQLLRAIDSSAGKKAKNIYIAEHDILYAPQHFDFAPPRPDTLYYDISYCMLDREGYFRFGTYLMSMLTGNRTLIRRLLLKRIRYIDMGWQPVWAELGIEEPDGEFVNVQIYRSLGESLDIRHDKNFTGGQIGSHFLDLPGWGKASIVWSCITA